MVLLHAPETRKAAQQSRQVVKAKLTTAVLWMTCVARGDVYVNNCTGTHTEYLYVVGDC